MLSHRARQKCLVEQLHPTAHYGSYCVQDGDKETAICKGIGKKYTGDCSGGGGDGSGGVSDSDGRLTRKRIFYLVQEYCMCG